MPAINTPRFRNPLMIVEEPVHQVVDPEGFITPPWNIGADVTVIPDEGARAAVPIPERVPRMIPPSDEKLKPVGPLEQVFAFIRPIGELRSQLGFGAHSVQVDNNTSQWLYFPAAQRYVPPWTWGVVMPLLQNTEIAQYTVDAPTGVTQVANVAGALVSSVWSAAMLPPSPGYPVPATYHP